MMRPELLDQKFIEILNRFGHTVTGPVNINIADYQTKTGPIKSYLVTDNKLGIYFDLVTLEQYTRPFEL